MDHPCLTSSNGATSPCESVKALHSRRGELKQRLQERHQRRRGEMRHERLEALRASTGSAAEGEVPGDGAWGNPADPPGAAALPSGMVPFAGSEWSDFGNQLHVDVSEPAVMEYLLLLEQEIEQEQLVAVYEQAHGVGDVGELEYYQYLMS